MGHHEIQKINKLIKNKDFSNVSQRSHFSIEPIVSAIYIPKNLLTEVGLMFCVVMITAGENFWRWWIGYGMDCGDGFMVYTHL